MLDWIGDIVDFIGDVIGDVDWGSVFGGIALVIGGIKVAELTYDSIRSELKKRDDLKQKGAIEVVVKDFIKQADGYEITLDALNNMKKSVARVKMNSPKISPNIKIGTRIPLQ